MDCVVNRMEANLVNSITDKQRFALKSYCVLCESESGVRNGFCMPCLGDLEVACSYCPTCARITRVEGQCAYCLRNADKFRFSDCITALPYVFPVDRLIHQLKFNRQIIYARYLGVLLANKIILSGASMPELLIPVPLHPFREITRGYNQSNEIGRTLSEYLGIDMRPDVCKRIRSTRAHSDLPAGARKKNIRGAFHANHLPHVRHVAIIDDVLTTGATVNELSKALYRCGVEKISIWVCARA